MIYYIARTVCVSHDDALAKVTELLRSEGFGVLTEIDVAATLKKRLDVDFRKYMILGACNPPLAHRALQTEELIGLMLPCNVIVHERDDGTVQVAAIDPVASMAAVDNPALDEIGTQVRDKLRNVIEAM